MYGQNLLVEGEDVKDLQVGDKVTLMKWNNVTITRRETVGDTFELFGTVDEADKDFKSFAKITWICNDPATTIEVKMMEFDHLITKQKIEENDDPAEIFNADSRHEDIGIAEGIVKSLAKGSYIQFERRGFYIVDSVHLENAQMVLNFIPDGKTKGMSILSRAVDAAETAKGKGAGKAAAAKAAKAGEPEEGKGPSKKDLKKA